MGKGANGSARGNGSRKIKVQSTAHTRRIGKNGSSAPQTRGKKKGKGGKGSEVKELCGKKRGKGGKGSEVKELCIQGQKKRVKRSHDLSTAVANNCGNATKH
jgi:hypothetical protein